MQCLTCGVGRRGDPLDKESVRDPRWVITIGAEGEKVRDQSGYVGELRREGDFPDLKASFQDLEYLQQRWSAHPKVAVHVCYSEGLESLRFHRMRLRIPSSPRRLQLTKEDGVHNAWVCSGWSFSAAERCALWTGVAAWGENSAVNPSVMVV